MAMVPHAHSWLLCPVHSFACVMCMLMSKPSDSASIFEYVPENRVVNYVNSLLSDMFDVWKQLPSQNRLEVFGLFTSHGIRHQAIEDLTDN